MKTAAILSRCLFGAIVFLTALCPVTSNPFAEGPDCLPKDPPPPVVKLKLRVPACAEPGSAIEYRMCIENCSASEAHHVTVKNALPANAKFVKADPAPSKQDGELQWNLGTIGGGATREIRLWLLPTNREDVKNCARVQFEHGLCVVTRQAGHPGGLPFDPLDPTKPPTVRPIPEVVPDDHLAVLDLAIGGPKEQYANLTSRYEIIVTNKSKAKAPNTLVSCTLPAKLKVVRASDAGLTIDDSVVWKLGELAPGASRTLELTLRATEKGEHCFKAVAEATPDLKKVAIFCTKFIGVSALSIEMKDLDDPLFLGGKTSFPILIKSLGSDPVTGIKVKAFVPTGLKFDRSVPMFDKREPHKEGEWIEFKVLPKIDANEEARYQIFVEATQAGRTRFHVEVSADQLDSTRPVIWEELTTIVDDRAK